MRTFSLSVFIIIFQFSLTAQSVEDRVATAIQLQKEGSYQQSLKIYEGLINEDYESVELYLNASNLAYEMGSLPKARIFVEKGLKRYPLNDRLNQNQKVLIEYLDSDINIVDDFFLIRFLKSVYLSFRSSTWAIYMIFALLLLLIAIGQRWFKSEILSKEHNSRVLWLASSISILCLICTNLKYQQEQNISLGVLTISAELKEGPDGRSNSKLELKAGETVEILDSIAEWRKISLNNKQLGWLPKNTLAEI